MTTTRVARHRAAVVALLTAVAAAPVAACQSPSSESPAPSSAPRSSAGPSLSPALAASPSSPVSSATVVADPTLLSVVPDAGNGLERTYDPDTTAQVAADPSLGGDASGLAIALYRPTGAAPDSSDFAIVNVVRLRDPLANDEWFRSWRDTYDESACAQAGGISRHLQTDIAGRTVYIGTCAGGAHTYHVRVAGGAIVISITAVGESRLGETILERLPA